MRTTVTLTDELADFVALYANAQGISRSKAISELLRQKTQQSSRITLVDGIPVFDVGKEGKKFGLEDLQRLQDEDI
jgi:hypothetical protein